jgi:hypothetical protein
MRRLLLAACLLPMSGAQANHRSLEDACALAAGVIVDRQHTNSVISVERGRHTRVVLELRSKSNGTVFPVTCIFRAETDSVEIARICVITTCYSPSAAYATRREVFEEVQAETNASGH